VSEFKFNPKNFRRIEKDHEPQFDLRTHQGSTLILIKSSGDAMYGRTRADKDHIVAEFDGKTDLLLWAWTGTYKTDIFLLTREELDRYYG
jgi:hypothetical protein